MKLLSLTIVKASWDSREVDAAKAFTDLSEADDRQNGLIRIAYRDGLIDSGTKDRFRPKEKLTNAEAISLMYKVMQVYKSGKPIPMLSVEHWSAPEVKSLLEKHRFSFKELQEIKTGILEDKPIPIELWHSLVSSVVGFSPEKGTREAGYTLGLARDGRILRGEAAAGLMKLWGPSRDATKEEREAAAKAFADYSQAFDLSKLALAYNLGVVKGTGSSFEPRRELTCAEALVMLSRIHGRVIVKE